MTDTDRIVALLTMIDRRLARIERKICATVSLYHEEPNGALRFVREIPGSVHMTMPSVIPMRDKGR